MVDVQPVVAARAEILAEDRPTAPDSAKMTPKATGRMRPMIAQPATASSPKRRDLGGDEGVADRRRDLRQHGGHADREERPRRRHAAAARSGSLISR